jgi:hypothetical protein
MNVDERDAGDRWRRLEGGEPGTALRGAQLYPGSRRNRSSVTSRVIGEIVLPADG